MPDAKQFAEQMLSGNQDRKKYAQEWQQSARAFDLELRFLDGRGNEGISWALYRRRKWSDDGGPTERLQLIFADTVVSVYGFHLKSLHEKLKEERLELIEEHDTASQWEIAARNEMQVQAALKEYICTKITVEPDFDQEYKQTSTPPTEQSYGHKDIGISEH